LKRLDSDKEIKANPTAFLWRSLTNRVRDERIRASKKARLSGAGAGRRMYAGRPRAGGRTLCRARRRPLNHISRSRTAR
jgi:hypothetical protein